MRWIPTALLLATLALAGCTALPGTDDDDDDACNVDEVWPVDFEAICTPGEWPTDENADGTWANSAVERRYGDEFLAQYQEVGGLTDAEMDCHVRIRRVDTYEAQQSSGTDVWIQVELGWVRIVENAYGSADGGDPTSEAIAAAWDSWRNVPRLDLDAELMAYADAQDFIDDCAAQHDVTFPDIGWCSAWVPDFANDDEDDRGLRFDFSGSMPEGNGWTAIASVDLTGAEPPSCRTTQMGSDEP